MISEHECFPVLSGLYLAVNKLDGDSITELTRKPGAFPLLDNLDLGENEIDQD